MEFQFIDVENLSEKELISILNKNIIARSKTEKEIEKLEKAKERLISTSTIVPLKKETKQDDKSIKIDEEFEEEIDYYLNDLSSITDDNIENIESILPNRNYGSYTKVVLRLLAELSREIKEINEFMLIEKDISLEEEQEFKKELQMLKKKINSLKQALSPKEKDDKHEEEEKNKLIFIPTSLGNPRVLDELKSIPQEYYPNFLELLNSIKDGTFKGVKRFSNNLQLQGASEVRGNQTRIVFIRLSNNCYGLLTAFIKKTDNDRGYRRPIELKMGEFRSMKDKLLESINDQEFLLENEQIERELFKHLGYQEIDEKEEFLDDKTRTSR